MIITRITGGPGNQLFQYATARRLADIHNTNVLLDIREFEKKTHRVFLLDMFKINANLANKSTLRNFLKFSDYFSFDHQKIIHKALPQYFPNIIYEKYFHFDKTILLLPNNVYLIGFWQSEKYFS